MIWLIILGVVLGTAFLLALGALIGVAWMGYQMFKGL